MFLLLAFLLTGHGVAAQGISYANASTSAPPAVTHSISSSSAVPESVLTTTLGTGSPPSSKSSRSILSKIKTFGPSSSSISYDSASPSNASATELSTSFPSVTPTSHAPGSSVSALHAMSANSSSETTSMAVSILSISGTIPGIDNATTTPIAGAAVSSVSGAALPTANSSSAAPTTYDNANIRSINRCDASWAPWLSGWSSYWTDYATTTESTQTYWSTSSSRSCIGGFTTLCDGFPRCMKAVSTTSSIFLSSFVYNVTIRPSDKGYTSSIPPFPTPTPKCVVDPDQCNQLLSAYYSTMKPAWTALAASVSVPINASTITSNGQAIPSPTPPTCSDLGYLGAYGDPCDSCTIPAVSVQLVYWPVTVRSQGVCSNVTGATITAPSTITNQPNTAIWDDGTVLVSPSVYISFATISAFGSSWQAGYMNGQGACGTTASNVMVPVDPQALHSYRGNLGFLGNWAYSGWDGSSYEQATHAITTLPFNYADLNYRTVANGSLSYPLVPASAYQAMGDCLGFKPATDGSPFAFTYMTECNTIWPDAYKPYLDLHDISAALADIDPRWASCKFGGLAFLDPPTAVQTQSNLDAPAPKTTPAARPNPATTVAAPGQTTQQPAQTAAGGGADSPTPTPTAIAPQKPAQTATSSNDGSNNIEPTPSGSNSGGPSNDDSGSDSSTGAVESSEQGSLIDQGVSSTAGSAAVITNSQGQSFTISQLPAPVGGSGSGPDSTTQTGAIFTVVGQGTTLSEGGGAATVSGIEISAASNGIATRPTQSNHPSSGNSGDSDPSSSDPNQSDTNSIGSSASSSSSSSSDSSDPGANNPGSDEPSSGDPSSNSPSDSGSHSGPGTSSSSENNQGSGSESSDPAGGNTASASQSSNNDGDGSEASSSAHNSGDASEGGWQTVPLSPAPSSSTQATVAVINVSGQSDPVTATQVSSGIFVVPQSGTEPAKTLSAGGSAATVGSVTLSAASGGIAVGGGEGGLATTVAASVVASDPPAQATQAVISVPGNAGSEEPVTASQIASGVYIIPGKGTTPAVTISQGGAAATVGSVTLSAAFSGVAVVDGHGEASTTIIASAVPAAASSEATQAVLTVPGETTLLTASQVASNVYVIPATGTAFAITVSEGGKAAKVNGNTVSAGSLGIVVDGVPGQPATTVSASAVPIASSQVILTIPGYSAPITASQITSGVFVIPAEGILAAVTISAGGRAATIAGATLSAGSSDVIVEGTRGHALSTVTASAVPVTLSRAEFAQAIITLSGEPTRITASQIASGVYVLPGQGTHRAVTLSEGGKPVAFEGATFSAGSLGVVIEGSSGRALTTIAASTVGLATEAIFTPSGQVPVSATQIHPGTFVIPDRDGGFTVTLSAGGPAMTLNGTAVSAGRHGLVVGGKTVPASIVAVPTAASSSDLGAYILSGLGGSPTEADAPARTTLSVPINSPSSATGSGRYAGGTGNAVSANMPIAIVAMAVVACIIHL